MNKELPESRSKSEKHIKNITRFTYDNSGFQGWRLSICRNRVHYTRYFSDREYGGEQIALAAAVEERERIYARMDEFPSTAKYILEEFMANKPKKYSQRGRRTHRKRMKHE